ncbi:hypothetical protein MNBD_ALPHA11-278 [hydrothermal vent metagenome]|uniref:YokE-like PH domain-containing protein n=1 Tax=hydrothermal vent metagenome TaxID=652676 RepID=A0A3B0TUJ3_9ZZZZ
MPKLTDELVQETLSAHLQDGEALKHWAFGIKQPSILLMVPLFALAILPGVIATQMLTKNYLIGLTDKRLIVLQVKSMTNAELKALTEYSNEELKASTVSFKAGKLFTHLGVESAEKPFKAKFHRMFSKGNREHAVAIGEAISAS